jgi:hypothetical protein
MDDYPISENSNTDTKLFLMSATQKANQKRKKPKTLQPFVSILLN